MSRAGYRPDREALSIVMAGLDPAIHVFVSPKRKQDVDARDKPAHDKGEHYAWMPLQNSTALLSRAQASEARWMLRRFFFSQ